MKQTRSKHKGNILNIHVHDVCSEFASCLLHHVNTPLCNRSRRFTSPALSGTN